VDLWSPNLKFRFHCLVSRVGPWFAWLSSPLAVFVFLPGAARLCLCSRYSALLRFSHSQGEGTGLFCRSCVIVPVPRFRSTALVFISHTSVVRSPVLCPRAGFFAAAEDSFSCRSARLFVGVLASGPVSVQILVTGPSLGLRSASCLHGFLGAGQIMVHAPQGFLSGRFFLFCILVTGDLSAHLIFFSRFFFRTGVCFTDFRAPNPCSGQAIFWFLFVLLLLITCFILCCVRSVGTV
jgi:hypothetical protein